jgi:murein DD-endopeptidase MepM/ murein hydrolase activator NlpD
MQFAEFKSLRTTVLRGIILSAPLGLLMALGGAFAVVSVHVGGMRQVAMVVGEGLLVAFGADLAAERSELEQARGRLRALSDLLQEVIEAPAETSDIPETVVGKGGVGGAPEPASEPLDELMTRLQAIRSKTTLDIKVDTDPLKWARHTPIGYPANGEITSEFGWRRSPFSGRRQLHGGIDISAPRRSTIFSTGDGVVRESGWKKGYGLSVVIEHGAGIETLYAHMSRIDVKAGQFVRRGQVLGGIGSSGNSTGPHLHYEIRKNGIAQNPERFVRLANLLKERFASVS